MSFMFWQGIKSLRSVAYFKEAMDAGGTDSLQQKWKDNPRWRDRLILSGVICASTVALLGRSVYRKAKKAFKKHKANKEKRKQEMLESDFDKQGHTLSKPIKSDISPIEYHDEMTPDVYEDERKDTINDVSTDVYYREPKEIDSIDAAFEADAMPTQGMYRLQGNLIKMHVITTKTDRPNCIMIANGDDMYYVNGSGIFDKNHNSYYIADMNETLAISKFIQHKEKSVINDFFSIFESFRA